MVNRISEGRHAFCVSDLEGERIITWYFADKYNVLGGMEIHTRFIMYDCSYV